MQSSLQLQQESQPCAPGPHSSLAAKPARHPAECRIPLDSKWIADPTEYQREFPPKQAPLERPRPRESRPGCRARAQTAASDRHARLAASRTLRPCPLPPAQATRTSSPRPSREPPPTARTSPGELVDASRHNCAPRAAFTRSSGPQVTFTRSKYADVGRPPPARAGSRWGPARRAEAATPRCHRSSLTAPPATTRTTRQRRCPGSAPVPRRPCSPRRPSWGKPR
jgi:hypothetical protein